ncbi:hypothetical protein AVEN_27233-1 [Araneus ventricosus]|uniref:Uncharacterized protein n=1 Tax=Araneus ventricosus TaxID=182803 RepID=A0A4Y2C9V0_ARAVE|nr:hypothetical protein AVEN_27233-1 [Araneus ventricosus]
MELRKGALLNERIHSKPHVKKIGRIPSQWEAIPSITYSLPKNEICHRIWDSTRVLWPVLLQEEALSTFSLALLAELYFFSFKGNLFPSFKTVQLHFPSHQSHKLTHFWQHSNLASRFHPKENKTRKRKRERSPRVLRTSSLSVFRAILFIYSSWSYSSASAGVVRFLLTPPFCAKNPSNSCGCKWRTRPTKVRPETFPRKPIFLYAVVERKNLVSTNNYNKKQAGRNRVNLYGRYFLSCKVEFPATSSVLQTL